MAYSNVINNAADYDAGADLSAEQYTFMKRTTGRAVVQANAGEAAVGVLWNDPAATGRVAVVVTGGRPHVYSSAIIANGAEIASTDEGEAVTAVSTDVVLGIALHAAVAGELVQIELLDGTSQYTKA